MYLAKKAIIFFYPLKTTVYVGSDRHQSKDRPEHAALYFVRRVI